MSTYGPRDFDVTLTDVAELVEEMRSLNRFVEDVAGQLNREIDGLHVTWTGQGARAHLEWQADWTAAIGNLRDGLHMLSGSCQRAHDNYASAVDANARMWNL